MSAESQPQTNRELSRGFTLLEVLLVLGLISMLAAVLIGGSASLLKGTARDDPEDAMLALLQTVRREAVEKNQVLTLKSVDNTLEDIATYTWGENHSETLPANENVKVKLVAPEVVAAILIGGQAEEKALSKVRFFPDGTCDRVRLEVSRSGERRIIPIDPLTCAPLPSENAK